MNTSADVWVRERRLRPVYELLDSGNNKKVITEVDKLLKKQPSFTCAKVLKALALVRMCKHDEADTILEPIHNEAPTDDGTIQALSICYRELERPEALCAYLEAACKKEQSEELLTHCFMAQVRVSEYQKQHQTALSLFKLYNKPNYFYWAIASLLVKFEQFGHREKEGVLSLKLAERMMDKAISEKKFTADEICINLYVNALEKLSKFDKLLEVLIKHGHGHPQSPWCNNDFHRIYCFTLQQLNKMDELFEFLKATFFKNPDEYAVLKQMIIVFGEGHASWIQDFFDHLIKNHPSRVVALADLFYCSEHVEDLEILLPRLEVDLELMIKYGGEKPSFSLDIADYYSLFGKLNVNTYLSQLEVNEYDSIGKIIKDVNYEIFMRAMIPDSSVSTRLQRANRCFGKYLACEEAMKTLRSENNMRTKESDFYDQFIVIAASSLLGENSKTSENKIDDYPTTILELKEDWASVHNLSSEIQEMHKTLYKEEPQDENVPVKEFSGKFMQKSRLEYMVFIAAAILEYGLERSPHNHSLRILLSRVYSRLGANYQAMKLVQALDLKHIQWDTLGYLIFHEAISGGIYPDAYKMLCSAENMYYNFRKESMEHIITCYKYNSYSKIGEFLGFRDQIFASIQYKIVVAERRLIELLLNCLTPQDLKKTCEGFTKELDMDLLLKEPHSDNRDFTVLEGFVSETCLDNLREASADVNCQYMKIRLCMLLLMTKVVAYAPQFVEAKDKFDILRILQIFDGYAQAWNVVVNRHSEAFANTSLQVELMFHGLWPPSFSRYNDLNALRNFHNFIQFILECANADKDDTPSVDRFNELMSKSCDDAINELRSKYPEDTLDQVPYFKIEEIIEKTHYAVESFSFFRILFTVAITMYKDKFDIKNAAAKKKARAKAMDDRKARSNSIQSALEKYKELHRYATSLHSAVSRRSYESFESTEAAWKTLLKPSFLYTPFPEYYDKFTNDVKESHEYQTKEIVKCCTSLIDFLRLLQP